MAEEYFTLTPMDEEPCEDQFATDPEYYREYLSAEGHSCSYRERNLQQSPQFQSFPESPDSGNDSGTGTDGASPQWSLTGKVTTEFYWYFSDLPFDIP